MKVTNEAQVQDAAAAKKAKNAERMREWRARQKEKGITTTAMEGFNADHAIQNGKEPPEPQRDAVATPAPAPAPAPVAEQPKAEQPADFKLTPPEPAAKPAKKVAAKKTPAVKKETTPRLDRSTAVSNSWQNDAVRAARAERSNVTVAGVQYRSVAVAFRTLKLPMQKHVKFRKDLKAAGSLAFEGHMFTIVKGD